MKNFNWKKYLFAFIAVFIVFSILDYLIHGVILMDTYSSMEADQVFRGSEEMQSLRWITSLTALVFSIFFVYLYHHFTNGIKKGGWKAGLYYGLVIGFLMLVTGMFNQYAVYPVTLSLTLKWFFFGLAQLAICGIVVGLIYKPLEIE